MAVRNSEEKSEGASLFNSYVLSRPGVFAYGDVRANRVKRVASAVGEGSMAVQFIHEIFEDLSVWRVIYELWPHAVQRSRHIR